MHIISYLGLLLGLIVLILLLVWFGLGEILNLLFTSGWKLLLLPVVWSPAVFVASYSWQFLFNDNRVPSYPKLLAANWMGRAINTLLPVATIGGEIAKARLITLWGCRGIDATASALVDKTVQALALIPWGIIGIILLLVLTQDNQIAFPALIGFSLLAMGIFGFILVQRAGMFGNLARLMNKFYRSDKWPNISDHARDIDQLVLELYSNHRKFMLSVILKTLSLMLETFEIWLACYLMGHNIGFVEAMMLKSLVSTVNNIVFFIPNAYGIQEGGFILFGALLGMSPDFSLALSLATRIRELCIDLPGVVTWQIIESRQFINKKREN